MYNLNKTKTYRLVPDKCYHREIKIKLDEHILFIFLL